MKTLLAVVAVSLLVGCESGGTKTSMRQQPPQFAPEGEAVSALSLSDDEVKDQVDAYLGTIDSPIKAEQWRGLGARGVSQLKSAMQSPTSLPTRRAKAIDGLVALKATEVAALMPTLANDEAEVLTVRLAAVRAMGVFEADAAGLTSVLQNAKDARVRAAAGEQLVSRPGGCGAVQRQLAGEAEESKPAYSTVAARCQGAPQEPSPQR